MSSLISCYVNKVRENLKIKDANVGKKKKKKRCKECADYHNKMKAAFENRQWKNYELVSML